MLKLILITMGLMSVSAWAEADCLHKMKAFNKASTTLKIKIHPGNGRTIKVQSGSVSESDGSDFNDVLRYCAYTMHRLDFYISNDGKKIALKCAITNVQTGAVNCSEPEAQEQAASFLSI